MKGCPLHALNSGAMSDSTKGRSVMWSVSRVTGASFAGKTSRAASTSSEITGPAAFAMINTSKRSNTGEGVGAGKRAAVCGARDTPHRL